MKYITRFKNLFISFFILSFLFFKVNVYATDGLSIHVFDVLSDTNDFGDAILLESNKQYLLIDTATDSQKIVNYLNKHNISHISILITHLHGDHYGGLNYLLDSSIQVDKLYMPDSSILKAMKKIAKNTGKLSSYQSRENVYYSKINKAEKNKTQVVYLEKGDSFSFGSTNVSVIGPVLLSNTTGDLINNFSLSLMIQNGNTKFLTCGDIERDQENALISSGVSLKADIFKLNHHGNTTGDITFLKEVNPSFTFRYINGNNNSLVSYAEKNSLAFSSSNNGVINFKIINDNIDVSVSKNYKNLKFQYYDVKTKNIIAEKTYPIQTGATFYPKQTWYRRKINGYKYASTVTKRISNVHSNHTIRVNYKQSSSTNSNINGNNNNANNNNGGSNNNGNNNSGNIGLNNFTSEEQDCNSLLGSVNDPDSVAWLLQHILNYIKVLGPLLVIVISSFDFAKIIIQSDDEAMAKAQKKLIMRLILVAALFFIPTIVTALLDIFGITTTATCGLQ